MGGNPPITYDKPLWRQLDPAAAEAYDALPEEQRQKLNESAEKSLSELWDSLEEAPWGEDYEEEHNSFQCSECGDEDRFSLKTCEVCGSLICPTCRSLNRLRVLCTRCDPDCIDPYSDDY